MAALWMAPQAWAQRIELLAGSTQGYAEGTGAAAQFSGPVGLAVDANGTVYVSEWGGHRIRKIAPNGSTSLLAGSTAGASGSAEGVGPAARFNYPYGLALNASGDQLLVADAYNNRIRQVPVNGSSPTTTFAGGSFGYAENTTPGGGTTARFNVPYGLALDASGKLLVTEFFGNRVRQIAPNGVTTLLAGDPSGAAGATEGIGAAARFNWPLGIAVRPNGQVLVADLNNHRIRQFMPGAATSTLAGSTAGYADGASTVARFNAPAGMALDAAGRLFVAEAWGHRIRMVLPDGTTSTIAGTGATGNGGDGGPALQAQFNQPIGLAVDGQGNLYVAEEFNHRVRKIILIPQAPLTPSAVAGSGQATVSWSAAPLAVKDDVQSYRVTASTGQTCTATAPATSCAVTGLTPGVPVSFEVKAINRAQFESAGVTTSAATPSGPAITSSALPNATEGQAYASPALVVTGGSGPYTWAVAAGSLPAGLALNASTGVISGTPSVNGPFSFDVTVTDANGVTSQVQTLSLTVDPAAVVVVPPTITSTGALPDATEGQAYSQTLQATGGVAPYTWTVVSGSLPPGLTLDAASGVISGSVPKVAAVAMQSGASASGQASKAMGTFSFSVVATGGGATPLPSAPQALSIQVVAAAPATVTPVPTLGAWALALLGVLTAGLGLRRKRGSYGENTGENSKALG